MKFNRGEKFIRKYLVREEHSAKHLGSGDVNVLSTPSMILFMEETCRIHADRKLEEGYTTVGFHLDIYHIKPAPIGSEVTIEAYLVNIDRRKLTYFIEAKIDDQLIGYGIHDRYIVERERFIKEARK